MGETAIEWTDRTWNPVRGCSRVSEGCRNCYAERQAARFSDEGRPWHGFAERMSPHDGLAGALKPWRPRWTGRVELVPEKLTEPLRWRNPQRVFVNSMSDLFHESLPDEAIDQVFAAIICAPQHTFQVLTKRPERMRAYLSPTNGTGNVLSRVLKAAQQLPKPRGFVSPEMVFPPWGDSIRYWPPRNVWLGVSVEDQASADARIPPLLQTPAAVRFVSAEPMLGLVDFNEINGRGVGGDDCFSALKCEVGAGDDPHFGGATLDWIICGGESGPGARPCDVAWIRSIVGQCRVASVPAFVKQLGAQAGISEQVRLGGRAEPTFYPRNGGFWPGDTDDWLVRIRDRKGGDPSEWPDDLRVRQFPEVQPCA